MSRISSPAVSYETLPWRARYPEALTARQRRELPRTYRSAVVPDIGQLDLALPSDIVDQEAQAIVDLVRFDSAVGASLLPWTSLLLRTESAASSRIERLTSSARRIVEEETFGGAEGDASSIVANTQAMRRAVALDGSLSLEALLAIHGMLLEGAEPMIAGTLRDEPVWIGGASHAPIEAMFVPPSHERLEPALQDLLAFARRGDLPPLAQIAIVHAQFATIHPFADGNGRTGRALIHVLLRQAGFITRAPLPLSAVLLTDTPRCFAALDRYRSGEPLEMIELIITAASAAAALGLAAGSELQAIHDEWQERVTSRVGAPDRELATLLISQPILDVDGAAHELAIHPQAARRALARLEEAGIVVGYQIAGGRRAWRAPDVLDLMDRTTAAMRRSL